MLQAWRNGLDWKREAGKVFRKVESLLPTITHLNAIDALDQVAFNLCYLTDTSNCLLQASWASTSLKRAAFEVLNDASNFMDDLNYDPKWYQLVGECLPHVTADTQQVGILMQKEWERHGIQLDAATRQTVQSAWRQIRSQRNVLVNKQKVAKLLGYQSYAEWFLADKFITSPTAMIEFLSKHREIDPVHVHRNPKQKLHSRQNSPLEIMNRIIGIWHLELKASNDTLHLHSHQHGWLGEIIIDRHSHSAHCMVLPHQQAYIGMPSGLPPSKLAHELGHAIHGLLWRGRHFQLRGTRGPWDSLEWPSMLMEELYCRQSGCETPDLNDQIDLAIADLRLHETHEGNFRHAIDYGSGYYAYPLGLIVARKMIAEDRVAEYLSIMEQGGLCDPNRFIQFTPVAQSSRHPDC